MICHEEGSAGSRGSRDESIFTQNYSQKKCIFIARVSPERVLERDNPANGDQVEMVHNRAITRFEVGRIAVAAMGASV
jgi:hypothetical protein